MSRDISGQCQALKDPAVKVSGPSVADAQAPHKWGPCLCETSLGKSHTTVSVESRTWPGVNKPGGVGRVTKRTIVEELRCGETVPMAYYDVKYLLGGSEKRVLETYIKCVGNDGKSARQACPRDIFTVSSIEPTRQSRPSSKLPLPSPAAVLIKPRASKFPTAPLASSRLANVGDLGKSSGNRSKCKGKGNGNGNWGEKPARMLKRPKPSESGVPLRKEAKHAWGQGDRVGEDDARRRAKKPTMARLAVEQQEPLPRITDLSDPVVYKETVAPLPRTRMAILSGHVSEVFNKNSTDKLAIEKLKKGINDLVPADSIPFNDLEMDSAFQFLENEENKLMITDGQVYLI